MVCHGCGKKLYFVKNDEEELVLTCINRYCPEP